ncbi:MAG: methyltransferase [Clostridia bacterium]|nr:methyltransferase [Clostridia bacterium]
MELLENERIDDLEFNNLKIIQNKNGFCFGIDSVLLSDYAKNLKKQSKVVDIGTGTGIIGILLCAKSRLKTITGIEIQEEVAKMAEKSIKLNNLQEQFNILNINIKEVFNYLEPNTIDCIVTNPPYIKLNTGARNIENSKFISRHEAECNLEDIIKISYKLLKSNGEFYMIHRTERLADIMYLLRKYRLEAKQMRFVQSKQNLSPNLILLKSIKNGGNSVKIDKPLIIYNEDGTYTEEVKKIYNKR